MKFKNFVFALSLAVLVLVAISSVSATCLSLTQRSVPSSVSHDQGTFTVNYNLTNSASCSNLTGIVKGWALGINSNIISTGSDSTAISIAAGETQSLSTTVSFPAYLSGNISTALAVMQSTNLSENATLVFSDVPIATSAPSLSLTNIRDLTRTQYGTINLTNTGNVALSNVNVSSTGDYNITLTYQGSTLTNGFSLNPGEYRLINVTTSSSLNNSNLKLGSNSITVTAAGATSTNSLAQATLTPSFSSISGEYCKNGNVNASQISITNIKDTSGKDWKWKPNDNMTMDVRIVNNFDSDQDFTITLALFDTTTKKFMDIGGEDENSLTKDGITIEKTKGKTVTFSFHVPLNVVASTNRYQLFVKAFKDSAETGYCNSYNAQGIMSANSLTVKDIEMKRKSHELSYTEIVAPDVVSAGESVTVPVKLYNIGTSDEDKVKVRVSNIKSKISYETLPVEILSEEYGVFSLLFSIPQNIENGDYLFTVQALYDFDEGSYAETVDKTFTLKVVGGVASSNSTANNSTVVAKIEASQLDSQARAGSEITVKTKITNTASSSATFVLNAKGYESWASLVSKSDSSITLAAGESKDVSFTLKIADGVSGTRSFFVEASSANKVDSREIEISGISAASLSSKIKDALSKNSFIWIIGLINFILIVLIIVVIVRIARR